MGFRNCWDLPKPVVDLHENYMNAHLFSMFWHFEACFLGILCCSSLPRISMKWHHANPHAKWEFVVLAQWMHICNIDCRLWWVGRLVGVKNFFMVMWQLLQFVIGAWIHIASSNCRNSIGSIWDHIGSLLIILFNFAIVCWLWNVMNTLTQYILIKNFVFIMIDMSPWQEVLTTRWQDKYPRGGLRDGDRGFHGFQGRTTNGQPNGLSTLFPSAINATGHSQQPPVAKRPLSPQHEQLPLTLPQMPEGRKNRQMPKPMGRPTGETSFSAVDPLAVSRSSLKFGATMRNSFVHEPGHAGQWPQLGHATAVRQFVRSRQGSRSDRASRANRGSRARASHAFEPIWLLSRVHFNMQSIGEQCSWFDHDSVAKTWGLTSSASRT